MPEGESKADPLDETDPGQVGPYVLLGRLGAGGMGRVYLARSPGGRLVAVKVVHAYLAHDPEFRGRFRHEVQAAQRVSGAFTAPVIAADPNAPTPWLATSYLDAPSLAQLIAERGPLPAIEVRSLAGGLAEALESVHQAGVIHRDLKPSNVLMVGDGPRLIDFGIARALDATAMTGTGVLIGSPGYVSPERLVTGTVSEAADVYALGAVLCFAAVGRGPHGQGEASMLYYRTVHAEPDLAGIEDLFLRELISRCLAKDPQERPSTADLLRMLNEVQVERAPVAEVVEVEAKPMPEPVPEPPASAPDPAPKRESDPAPTWFEPNFNNVKTSDLRAAPTYVEPPYVAPLRAHAPTPDPTRSAKHRRTSWIAAASVLGLAGAAALTYTLLNPTTPIGPTTDFLWSVPADPNRAPVGFWSDSSRVVLGTPVGLTSYDLGTGKAGWTWNPPDTGALCGMSPSASQDIGAVDYSLPADTTTDNGGEYECAALQTISLADGSPFWSQAVALGPVNMFGYEYPSQYGSWSLSIGGGVVTGPYSTAGEANKDVVSVALSSGSVSWASDSQVDPVAGDCVLDGKAVEFDGSVYAADHCQDDQGNDQLLSIRPGSLSVAVPAKRSYDCGQNSSGSFFAQDTDYLLIGCSEPTDQLFALRAGSAKPVPLDLTGVDTDSAGPFSLSNLNATSGMNEPSDLAMSGNILYLEAASNNADDGVIAVNMDTGKQLWTKTLNGQTGVTVLAATSAGVEVVAGDDGSATLYTLSAADGTVQEGYRLTPGIASDFFSALEVGYATDDTYAAVVGSDLVVLFAQIPGYQTQTVLGVLPLPGSESN